MYKYTHICVRMHHVCLSSALLTVGNECPTALLCEEDQRRPPGSLSGEYLLERYHVGISIGLGFRTPDNPCRRKWDGIDRVFVVEKVVRLKIMKVLPCDIFVRR